MSFLTLSGLVKRFGSTTVVHGFDLAVERGEFISLLGPSGCGKTTVLRMIAGFETPSAGHIIIDGADITRKRPAERNVGMVFQAYALFPNMNVADNIAFGMKIANMPQAAIEARVTEMLALIKLPDLAKRYPYQLSGGQQQRVALARALAVKPQVLLLDEPLSALDAKIRVSLREEIRALQQELGITTIFVTHDQEEALSMSDRVVVMNDGRAEQIGTPHMIYNHPKTRFVASFVGTLNMLEAQVEDPANGIISLAGHRVRVASGLDRLPPSASCMVALRPEALAINPAEPAANALPCTIVDVQFLGAIVRIKARCGDHILSVDTFNQTGAPAWSRGDAIALHFNSDEIVVLA